MTNLQTIKKLQQIVKKKPSEYQAVDDLFEMLRIYESENFEKAHLWNKDVRRITAQQVRASGSNITLGRTMAGESAKKPNMRYHYYACSGKKRFRDCNKKNVSKELIEKIIVEDTVKKVLTKNNIELIADIAIKELEKDKNNNTLIKALEVQLKENVRGIDGLLKAFEHGAASDSLVKRLNNLEKQKKDIEARIIREQKEYPSLDKDCVLFWLKSFLEGDIDDPDYRRHIIDMLVNKAFVFDDPGGMNLTITYNLSSESESEIRLGDIKALGSDLSVCGSPKHL